MAVPLVQCRIGRKAVEILAAVAIPNPDPLAALDDDGKRMIEVSVQMEPEFKASQPRTLFEGSYFRGFDVFPDGQHFLMMKKGINSPLPIQVVLNWFEELERLVPADTPE